MENYAKPKVEVIKLSKDSELISSSYSCRDKELEAKKRLFSGEDPLWKKK